MAIRISSGPSPFPGMDTGWRAAPLTDAFDYCTHRAERKSQRASNRLNLQDRCNLGVSLSLYTNSYEQVYILSSRVHVNRIIGGDRNYRHTGGNASSGPGPSEIKGAN